MALRRVYFILVIFIFGSTGGFCSWTRNHESKNSQTDRFLQKREIISKDASINSEVPETIKKSPTREPIIVNENIVGQTATGNVEPLKPHKVDRVHAQEILPPSAKSQIAASKLHHTPVFIKPQPLHRMAEMKARLESRGSHSVTPNFHQNLENRRNQARQTIEERRKMLGDIRDKIRQAHPPTKGDSKKKTAPKKYHGLSLSTPPYRPVTPSLFPRSPLVGGSNPNSIDQVKSKKIEGSKTQTNVESKRLNEKQEMPHFQIITQDPSLIDD